MIIVLKPDASPEQLAALQDRLAQMGLTVQVYPGGQPALWGLVGDTSRADANLISSLDGVACVRRIRPPYRLAGREAHPADTVVEIGKVKIGGGNFAMLAGPCSVETEAQILRTAIAVKDAGTDILRGGAYKPRTSPYTFQGLGKEGIRLLLEAKKVTGLPVVTEITDIRSLEQFADVDVIQVGARNMQNYELLRQLGKSGKPILLKRGPASTLRELLLSAEYLLDAGNGNVILCERGIRTWEDVTRATLDLSAVPALHELSHLPVIVDPSHATGRAALVPPMAAAAAAAGADGVMVEVHCDPSRAWCDGAQALTPEAFARVCATVRRVREAVSG